MDLSDMSAHSTELIREGRGEVEDNVDVSSNTQVGETIQVGEVSFSRKLVKI